jgi:hypothetical protein
LKDVVVDMLRQDLKEDEALPLSFPAKPVLEKVIAACENAMEVILI